MAWTSPSTVVVSPTALLGAVTAALWNSDVRDNMLMGQPTFTTEAARDVAISSPVEGMVAYITAPTVPAAAGGVTAVPTGVTTIYNGSVWVCVTEVGAWTTTSGTTASTPFIALTGGGTNPSVTLVTGTTASVSFGSEANSSNIMSVYLGVSINAVSATSPLALQVSSSSSAYHGFNLSRSVIVTGLTAGTNTFALQYGNSSGTASYSNRHLAVKGVA